MIRLTPLGDRAVSIVVGDSIDEATHRRVRAVCARLDARPVAGSIEWVPAYAAVVVHYDPARVPPGADSPYERFAAALEQALAGVGGAEAGASASREVEIPVCYGGEAGPDLDEVARRHGMTPEEVVRIHCAGDYLVYMIGFAPGFPYLGGLDERIATPRHPTPRPRVPARSVGIGGRQTGIYPVDSPGGWWLIGRTPLRLFDPTEHPPALLRMGDRIRFRSISPDELRAAEAAR